MKRTFDSFVGILGVKIWKTKRWREEKIGRILAEVENWFQGCIYECFGNHEINSSIITHTEW